MHRDTHSSIPVVMSAIAGITGWIVIAGISGKSEAWDSQYYWIIGYPLLCVVCFVLGWSFPKRAWSYGFVAMFVQTLPMLIMGGSDLSLLPLGLIFLGIISMPLSVSGLIGSWFKGRYGSSIA